jgi:hypothetical protein
MIKITVSKREPVLFMNIYRAGGRKKLVLTWTLLKNEERQGVAVAELRKNTHSRTLSLSLSETD